MSDDPNTMMILGEVRGQLREMNHHMTNQTAENAVIARQLAKLESVPTRLDAIEKRLGDLEKDRHRRDGAMGIGSWLMKSPVIAWIVAAAVGVVAYIKGAFH